MADQTTQNPTVPDTLAADDPRMHLATAIMTARPTIAAITSDQYDLPTPCEGMTVGELAEHIVMAMRRVALAGRGEPRMNWPIDAADVARGEWEPALVEAAHDVQAAWGDEILDRPTVLPWGEFPGREVLGVYTNEVIVHTWDLARATGQNPEWDPSALEFADSAMHAQLPMADRTEMWNGFKAQLPPEVPWEDPFGPAVDVPADAPTIDRLVAWNGRTP